jgi:hypothetical protein
VARPVFKTATEGPSGTPVGSIPTRSRHPLLRAALTLALAATLLPGAPRPAGAQAPAADSLVTARPLRPMGGFFMSLAVPGWAQARLDRKLTAGLFVMWEGVTLGMTLKTVRELGYLTRTGADSTRLDAKRQQRQDWLILLGFNHLFAGLEAFVSSQLHDFPADVRFRALPAAFATEVAIPFRLR